MCMYVYGFELAQNNNCKSYETQMNQPNQTEGVVCSQSIKHNDYEQTTHIIHST